MQPGLGDMDEQARDEAQVVEMVLAPRFAALGLEHAGHVFGGGFPVHPLQAHRPAQDVAGQALETRPVLGLGLTLLGVGLHKAVERGLMRPARAVWAGSGALCGQGQLPSAAWTARPSTTSSTT